MNARSQKYIFKDDLNKNKKDNESKKDIENKKKDNENADRIEKLTDDQVRNIKKSFIAKRYKMSCRKRV